MWRAVAIGALACASCSSPEAPEAALPAGGVVLGRFTAEVDPTAGTFVIRNTPTAAGRALGSPALVALDGDVTVANKVVSGTPVTFFNVGQGAGRQCTDGSLGNVWGATVTITNTLADTLLGGVYVEITSAFPSTSVVSCSSAPPPPGLSAAQGLWAYGPIAASGAADKDWVFKYTTAAKFTFTGQVVGARSVKGDWSGALVQRAVWSPGSSFSSVVDAGTYIAVANHVLDGEGKYGIDFVNKSTGEWVSTLQTSDLVEAMAVAAGRVWFTAGQWNVSPGYVGWVNADGTGSAIYDDANAKLGVVFRAPAFAIVADRVSPTAKAWILWSDYGYNHFIASYTPGASTGAGSFGAWVSNPGSAYALVYGPGNFLYVPVPNNASSVVALYATPDGPGAATLSRNVTTDCQNPDSIAQGQGSKLYVSAYAGEICAFDYAVPGDHFSKVSNGPGIGVAGLAIDATTGSMWLANGQGGALWQLDTSWTTNNNVRLMTGNGYSVCRDSNGAIWYPDGTGLWKITVQ